MDLKSLSVLLFVVCHAFSINATATEDERSDETKKELEFYSQQNPILKVFYILGERITYWLSEEDLKNMLNASIECAGVELNRRSKILHYRNGVISPPFVAKYHKLSWYFIENANFTGPRNRIKFQKYNWTPYQGIFFGNKNPINTTWHFYRKLVMISSHKDHLKLFHTFSPVMHTSFMRLEMQEEENPMNGVIFPWGLRSPKIGVMPIEIVLSRQPQYNLTVREKENDPLKLAIVIDSAENNAAHADNRALNAARIISNDFVNTSVCVVSQSDIRKNSNMENGQKDSLVLLFHGSNMIVSTFVADKKDTNETLKANFEEWKQKELLFLNSHEITAFHLTVVDGNEAEKREKIFSEVFPNIPLSTLRLLDESSLVGVNKQTDTSSRFHEGAVFVMIGLEKFGLRKSV